MFLQVVGYSLLLGFAGAVLGLVLRLLGMGVKPANLLETCLFALMLLLIYPFFLPIILLVKKDILAGAMAKEIIERTGQHTDFAEVKRQVLRRLSVWKIIGIWFRALRTILVDYDTFVTDSVLMAQRTIVRKRREVNTASDGIFAGEVSLFHNEMFQVLN